MQAIVAQAAAGFRTGYLAPVLAPHTIAHQKQAVGHGGPARRREYTVFIVGAVARFGKTNWRVNRDAHRVKGLFI